MCLMGEDGVARDSVHPSEFFWDDCSVEAFGDEVVTAIVGGALCDTNEVG